MNIPVTMAHDEVPRKALVKIGDLKGGIQTVNDAFIEPGKSFTPHTHYDCEEFYYFLEGDGILKINKTEYPITEGDFVIISVGDEHSVTNTGKKKLRYLTVRYKIKDC